MQVQGFPKSSVLRIAFELFAARRRLRGARPCVTVFGSARITSDTEYYRLAEELGFSLAQNGYTILTGGGPGVMEAASKGAKAAGGHTVGCNIQLLPRQAPNAYLDRLLTFEHFFVRKTMLVYHSSAFVVLPGGLGTLDELFEVAVLMQKEKIRRKPIVLLGLSFWQPLLGALQSACVGGGTVSVEDLTPFRLTDSVSEAVDCVVTAERRLASA